jgi:hypothetical protein
VSTGSGGRSGLVAVDDLEAGMTLAEDVRDQQGRLLMPAATELTERHLRAFQLWGIPGVRIRRPGEEAETTEREVPPELLAEAEAIVQERLRHNNVSDPVIAELRRICVARVGQKLVRGQRG